MFENVVGVGDGYLRGAALTGNCERPRSARCGLRPIDTERELRPSADYRAYADRFKRA